MIKFILSELLHRANREYVDDNFYKVKNKILKQYGRHVDYDVQFIEGKKCYSCDGTGIYEKFYHNSWHKEQCYNCDGGWYKRPVWNILAKVKFGKYTFHQPFQRAYKKPEISNTVIEGYIDHTRAKYGATSLFILMLIYEKGYLKRWWRNGFHGWRVYWYWPRNWGYCIIHILRHGRNSYPYRKIYDKIYFAIEKLKKKVEPENYGNSSEGELPF